MSPCECVCVACAVTIVLVGEDVNRVFEESVLTPQGAGKNCVNDGSVLYMEAMSLIASACS